MKYILIVVPFKNNCLEILNRYHRNFFYSRPTRFVAENFMQKKIIFARTYRVIFIIIYYFMSKKM
jgi:hypothetical protein